MGLIIRQSFKNLLIIYIGLFIGYCSTVLLSPLILTEDQIGLIRLLINVSVMFSTFAALGSVNIPTKYFPYFKDTSAKHHGFLFFLITVAFIGFLVFTIFFLGFKNVIYSIYITKAPLLVEYFYYFLPLTFLILYFNIFQSYLIQNQKPVATNFIREIIIRILIITALLFYFIKWINFKDLINSYVLVYAIALLVIIWHVKSQKLLFIKPNLNVFKSKYIKEIITFGGFALLGGMSGVLIANIDGIMLSAYKGLGPTGIYTIAFLIATIIEIPKRSISQSVIALISEGNKNNNKSILENIYKKTSINQFIMGSFIFLGIWCNIDNIFKLIPNSAIYAQGKWVVLYIGLGKLFDLATGSNYEILSTSKYYKIDLLFVVLLGVLAIITNMIFIPIYGITGAALASAISIFIFNIFRYSFIFLKMKLQPFTIDTLKELIIVGFILLINYFVSPQINFIFDIFLRSIIISVLFVSLTILFKISDDFNLLFNKLLNKIIQKE